MKRRVGTTVKMAKNKLKKTKAQKIEINELTE